VQNKPPYIMKHYSFAREKKKVRCWIIIHILMLVI